MTPAPASTAPNPGWVSARANDGSRQDFLVRLLEIDAQGSATPFVLGSTDPAIDPAIATFLVIHGRRDDPPPLGTRLEQLYPRLSRLAMQLATQQAITGARVLFFDWGTASADGGQPPNDAAQRIGPVATWLADALRGTTNLTVLGHSLGSHVASQVATQLTPDRLISLDPAFPAGNYDIDGFAEGQQAIANLNAAAAESVAFVVADTWLQVGLAGDNQQAGTAHTSFVAQFDGLDSIFSAAEAHGAVVDLYTDISRYLSPDSAILPILWNQFENDRYTDGGDRGAGLHEGVAYADRDDAETWRIQWIDGDGTDLYFANTLQPTPDNDDGGHDTVLTLLDLALDDSLEDLVLGGWADLNGVGNALDNRLQGNGGANHLRAGLGSDIVNGEDGNDQLWGDGGDDILRGHAGADLLVGGDDTDILRGGSQDDRLQGDRGSDHLVGGAGSDRFVLQILEGLDTIYDFVAGVDQLELPTGITAQNLERLTVGDDILLRYQDMPLARIIGVNLTDLNPADFV